MPDTWISCGKILRQDDRLGIDVDNKHLSQAYIVTWARISCYKFRHRPLKYMLKVDNDSPMAQAQAFAGQVSAGGTRSIVFAGTIIQTFM